MRLTALLSQKNLSPAQVGQLYQYIGVANYLENVGDVIENNVLTDAAKRIRLGVNISPATVDALRKVHNKVCWALDRALDALRDSDQSAAHQAVESKTTVNELAEKTMAHLVKRLVAYEPNRLVAYRVESDIVENLKRINTLTRRIARVVLAENETRDSKEATLVHSVSTPA